MMFSGIIEFFKSQFKGDKVIWRLLFILSAISLLAVYGSVSLIAIKGNQNNTTIFLLKQAFTLGVGIAITYWIHKLDYSWFFKLSTILVILSAAFLMLTFSKTFAVETNNANRWIQFPGIGLRFQPSEFAKTALLIFIAKILSIHQKDLGNVKKVLYPILIVSLAISVMVLISNFSTAFFILITTVVMLFFGRIPWKQMFALAGVGLFVGILMLGIILKAPDIFPRGATWQKRIVSFMPNLASQAKGYDASKELKEVMVDNHQVTQAKIAIAEGGVLGKAPGNSSQKYKLSQAYCDFIYAIIIEDYGLLGGFIVMGLYLILMYRAGRIVKKCEYTFPALLVIGLTFSMVFQAFVHMGVAVNLLPATGQTMPIISLGGTSLLTTSVSFGIILGVSRKIDAEEKKPSKKEHDTEETKKTNETQEEA